MVRLLKIVLVYFITVSSAYAQVPDEYIVAFIDVSGAEKVDPEIVKSISGLYVGQRIRKNDKALANAVRNLWEQGLVSDAEILVKTDAKGLSGLEIIIQELSRLNQVRWEGLKEGQIRKLKDKIELHKGQKLSQESVNSVAHMVRESLHEEGFHQSKVSVHLEKHMKGESNLVITVEMGSKVKVRNIKFIGNQAFGERKLRKLTKIGSRGLNFRSKKFEDDLLEEAENELGRFYRENGYIDFVVNDIAINPYGNSQVDIAFDLYEGKKYYVGGIQFKGNIDFPDSVLHQIFQIKTGDVYNPEYVNVKLNYDPKSLDIRSFYMDQGYLFFDARANIVGIEGNSVNLEILLQEGDLAKVRNVSFSGNTITNDDVLRREVTTLPGDQFSRSAIMRSQSNLALLGFLDPEQMNVIPKPNQNTGTVDLEYVVSERPNDQIEMAGTWAPSIGLTGSLGFVANNFDLKSAFKKGSWSPFPRGNGEQLALRIQSNGTTYTSYSLQYNNPWISQEKRMSFFTNLSHTTSSFTDTRTLDSGETETVNSKLKISGGRFGVSRRLHWGDGYWSLSNSIGLYQYKYRDYENALGVETGKTYNLSLNTTLGRNTINHPFYPTTGSTLSISLSMTPPYAMLFNENYATATGASRYKWAEYFKVMADYKIYLPLIGKLVLKGGLHFGLVDNYAINNPLGPFERFEMGGSGLTGQSLLLGNDIISLRGYDSQALLPVDDQGIEGGTVYQKLNVEIRYPIVLSSGISAYGLVFAESGNTWSSLKAYDPSKAYNSAGFGLQLQLPMVGTVGFNMGYGFNKLPGFQERSGWNFQFNLGLPIR